MRFYVCTDVLNQSFQYVHKKKVMVTITKKVNIHSEDEICAIEDINIFRKKY